eukprot:g73650.t1
MSFQEPRSNGSLQATPSESRKMGANAKSFLLGLLADFPFIRGIFICDSDGVIILRESKQDAKVSFEQENASWTSAAILQGSKIGLGESSILTLFYRDGVLIQSAFLPLVITIFSSADANVGAIQSRILPALKASLEPLRNLVEEQIEQEEGVEEEDEGEYDEEDAYGYE